ncbi:MAG TPA: D-alanyl-D-alanine carboxypeptidase/D-alanyl-D-alanine-endopeptidase [Gemmatimonadales bacterium]|nr:D-alanyl-D-alanine carboxypeptidase/D-alanyl-D-alanine-endopeptidase [Gemmatimonadales bacterium]
MATTHRRLAAFRLAPCAFRLAPSAFLALLPSVCPPVRLSAQIPELAKQLDARFDAPPFNRTLWGAVVMDERGRVLYARNAERLFVPASTLKLVVSATAAVLLPPDWTVRTSVYANGPVAGGVVQGDLVLYGRGDPTMSRRCYGLDTTRAGACVPDPTAPLRRLADALKARGIHTIAGDVMGDGSWFEPMLVHPAWENYDLNWWYAAPVSGLGVADNSVDLAWSGGPVVGGPPPITVTPDWAGIRFENRAVTTPGDTGTTLDFFREPGTLHVWAEGRVAQGAAGTIEHFALPDPAAYTARAFRTVLIEAGVAVRGTVRSTTDSTLFAAARRQPPLAEVPSRPLADWIFPILNSSQNWFAEMLLKQLGRQFAGVGSWSGGLGVERRFLVDSARVDSTQFSLADGSGLSTTNLISPLALARLLQYARRHPRFATIADALPRAGGRGSLRTRFAGTPAAGRVQAKTGSVARVNALAGYLELEDGRVLSFAVMANHHALPNRPMMDQIDSAVVDVARLMGRGKRR